MKPLVAQAKKRKLLKAEEAIRKLKEHAGAVLSPVPEWVGCLQTTLYHEVQLYRCLLKCIEQTAREAALLLAQTPAAMMTTMKGTGIMLAAGVGSELGAPEEQSSVRRLTSYAGIIPRVKQTGGPQGEPHYGRVSRRCNHLLKNYLVQCGNHMGQHGPEELKEDHRRRGARGQHADFGMACRFVRIGMKLMRENLHYRPASLLSPVDREQISTYYLECWPRLRDIWHKAGALEEAFRPENPLGKWRECIEAIYQIELPLNVKRK